MPRLSPIFLLVLILDKIDTHKNVWKCYRPSSAVNCKIGPRRVWLDTAKATVYHPTVKIPIYCLV